MRPDDIRRLYAAETEATASEAARTREEARSDPDQARRLVQVLYAMSVEDRIFADAAKRDGYTIVGSDRDEE